MILLLISFFLYAVDLPTGLNSQERDQVVEILGLGTSSKILTIPYPLGGYAGIEFGLSLESLPVENLTSLGNQTAKQDSFDYPKISIGKGLLEDTDLFLHFIPFSEQSDLTEYGGVLRWNFYKAKNIPGSLSLVGHFNSSNIKDQFTSESYGLDILAGITVESLSLYFGIGQVEVKGTFVGGTNAITDSGQQEVNRTKKTHSIIGASYHFLPYFIAFQIDQYETTVMSAKLGLRY
tara:strand:+ start:1187 stop:1891 length:705 start_codon:yes stop_codon:yes gene_type:complete